MNQLWNCFKTSHALKSALLSSLLLITSMHASAATVTCITAGDTAGLQAALATAANNNDDDIIELQTGLYVMPTNFPLSYSAAAEQKDLTIEGGYSGNMAGPCGAAPTTPNARQTLLYGGTLYVHMAGAGSFALKSVTIENTFSADPTFSPVEIGGYIDFTGSVTIENAMFLGNWSTTKSAVYIFAAKGSLTVQDSVFANNQSSSPTESAVHLGSLSTTGSLCALIINSTFASNSTAAAAAVDVYASMCIAAAANDIFWDASPAGVKFEYPQWAYLTNDDFYDLSEADNAAQATALLSADPMFINSDFSLGDMSPLRDLGSPGGFIFAVGPYDVIGNPRTYGAKPDIGAFEIQDVIFAHGFDFTLPF